MMEHKGGSFNETSSIKKRTTQHDFFAEIVEASLEQCTAQCWQWDIVPAFGSLVQVATQEHIVLGIVTQVSTGSMDPIRYPFPYQKTELELKAEQPQIFEFLKTTFTVQILGYLEKKVDKIYYLLPVRPCKIHAFIQQSSQENFIRFFKDPMFLHMLFTVQQNIKNFDELLLSVLHRIHHEKILTSQMLKEFCQTFSLLSGNDYRRLKLFLKRVEHILA